MATSAVTYDDQRAGWNVWWFIALQAVLLMATVFAVIWVGTDLRTWCSTSGNSCGALAGAGYGGALVISLAVWAAVDIIVGVSYVAIALSRIGTAIEEDRYRPSV